MPWVIEADGVLSADRRYAGGCWYVGDSPPTKAGTIFHMWTHSLARAKAWARRGDALAVLRRLKSGWLSHVPEAGKEHRL